VVMENVVEGVIVGSVLVILCRLEMDGGMTMLDVGEEEGMRLSFGE